MSGRLYFAAFCAGTIAAVLPLACFPVMAQTPAAPEPPRFVIVLDAAHGGSDTGAKLGNQQEKDVTLAASIKLRSLLMARGITVATTRESDVNLDADRRAEIANHANAKACLDLHAAAASGKNPSAVHLFLSSLPAAKNLNPAPWHAAQSASIARSMALAGVVNSALTQAGIPVTLGRTPLGVIDSMTCPAVAIEISEQSSQDAADESEFESKVLDALAAALVEWRAEGAQLSEGWQP